MTLLNRLTNCTLEISGYHHLMKMLFEGFFETIWIIMKQKLYSLIHKLINTHDTLDRFDGGFLWMVSGRVKCLTHPCSRTNEPVTKMSRLCHELTGVTRGTCHIVSRDQRCGTQSRIWNDNWQMEIKVHCYCYSPSVFVCVERNNTGLAQGVVLCSIFFSLITDSHTLLFPIGH